MISTLEIKRIFLDYENLFNQMIKTLQVCFVSSNLPRYIANLCVYSSAFYIQRSIWEIMISREWERKRFFSDDWKNASPWSSMGQAESQI
jgi:hypothetical protein